MSQRLLMALLASIGIVAVLFVLFRPATPSSEVELERLEEMLAQHAYWGYHGMTPEDVKGIAKKDRPDLAILLDHMRTMDPATGEVPRQRLFEANRRATTLKRGGTGSLLTEEWEERGPTNVGGRTRALMWDPNDPDTLKVWAGGVSGGLWYTEDISDPNETWIGVDDFWANLAVTAIDYDPTNTQVFYVGTGEGWFNIDAVEGAGIFKSEDGGATWQLLPSTTNSTFNYIQSLLVHPETGDVYAATRNGGVQRSQDGGETWERVLGSGVGAPHNRAADLEIGADGTLYASFGIFNTGRAYRSETGDPEDWEPLGAWPASGIQRIELAVAPSDANVLYAATQQASNSGNGGIFRSDDRGETWTLLATPINADPGIGDDYTRGQGWYDLIIVVDPNDPDHVIVGGVDLHKSKDGGASWTQISHWYGGFGKPYVHADHHEIVFRPGSSNEAIFSHDGGIDYTVTATATQPTFINRNLNYNVTQFYAGSIHPGAGSDVMLAGAQDNGTQRFSLEGTAETEEVYGGDGGFNFIDHVDPNYAVASYVYNRYYLSTNGGLTFPIPLLQNSHGLFINPADYDSRESILYTAYSESVIKTGFYRIKNLRGQRRTTRIDTLIQGTPNHLRVSPHAPEGTSTLFIGTTGGRIFKVTNPQEDVFTVEEIPRSGRPAGAVSSIDIGPTEDQLLVTYSNYGVRSVWETFDSGQTWINRTGDLPEMPVRWGMYHPESTEGVILATEAGVWETTNLHTEEPSWTPSPSFPTVRVDMLRYRPSDHTVMAATHGRGVYTARFRSGVVAAEPGAAPASHALVAAYPNPFAERTTLTLSLEEPQRVSVEVFNTLGRRVAVLHDGPLGAGTEHRFTLEGGGLASGTYLYTVTGERFRESGRVTLVR